MGKRCFYVYVLVDPRDRSIFYVGKGKGGRRFQHLKDWRNGRVTNAAKFDRIGAIVGEGLLPNAIIFRDGLTENDAFAWERKIIAALGIDNLANVTPGQLTSEQKARSWAHHWMARLKPFDQWKNERRPSAFEISIYDGVKRTIVMMASREAVNAT